MRANAPIAALLALAALSLFSAPLEARTHKPAAHKARAQAEAPAKKHSKGKAAPQAESKAPAKTKPKHHARRHRQESVEDTAPATITRIHAHTSTSHDKATSSDFLQAAGATPQGPALSVPVTQHPDPEPAPRQTATKSNRRLKSVARQAEVVSVIRPDAGRPSLPSIQEAAVTPMILPSLYNKRGRLVVPPPLRGSHEILLRQNQVADRDGLDRIRDDDDIVDLREHHLLVALPTSASLSVDERLPTNRRYCRPWTAQFLNTLSHAYYDRFHTPLQINSAVRTVEFQQRLLRTNGNAAPAEGDTASPHLTGQAVDLAKHGLSLTQIAWLRGYLLPLVQEGKVDVEEEFQQACFHISVYKKYLPPGSVPRRSVATTVHNGTETTAMAVR